MWWLTCVSTTALGVLVVFAPDDAGDGVVDDVVALIPFGADAFALLVGCAAVEGRPVFRATDPRSHQVTDAASADRGHHAGQQTGDSSRQSKTNEQLRQPGSGRFDPLSWLRPPSW